MAKSPGKQLVSKAIAQAGPRPHGGGNAVEVNGGQIGQEEHEPTPRLRAKVELLAALGNSQEAIAFACDVAPNTLRKHYDAELMRGKMNVRERLGAAILQTACGEEGTCVDCEGHGALNIDDPGRATICGTCHGKGTVWVREPNPTAQVWASKNLMGWSDKARIEHTGDGGGPIVTEQRDAGQSIRQKLKAIRERQDAANDKAA